MGSSKNTGSVSSSANSTPHRPRKTPASVHEVEMHAPPAVEDASTSSTNVNAGPCEYDYDVNSLTNTDKVLKQTREAGIFTENKK